MTLSTAVVAYVLIYAPDLDADRAFFAQLGYTPVGNGPWAPGALQPGARCLLLSDGQVRLLLHTDADLGAGLLFALAQEGLAGAAAPDTGPAYIAQLHKPLQLLPLRHPAAGITLWFCADPAFDLPRAMPPLPNPTPVGTMGELALPVNNLQDALAFWDQLNFVGTSYSEPEPWAIVRNESLVLGLHQTTQFTKPQLTYFSAQMPDIIDNLKRRGLRFAFELPAPDGSGQTAFGGLISPSGGQGVFLFAGSVDDDSDDDQ